MLSSERMGRWERGSGSERVLAWALVGLVGAVGAPACTKRTEAEVVTQVCEPASNDCQEDTLRRCNDVGSGWDIVERCPPGTCIGAPACGGPVAPIASTEWVDCTPGSGGDLTKGDPPCKPVTESGVKIDPFEVTRSQYLAFWRATANGRNTLGLGVECDYKKTIPFTPSVEGWPTLSDAQARLPITGVDGCDARAYCRWAGKRLCGGTDGKPSREPFAARGTTPVNDAWQRVCETAPNDTGCNVRQNQGSASRPIAPVGSFPQCKTPGGVYDLHGNVAEIVDVCTDQFLLCRRSGGSAENYGVASDCASNENNYVPDNRRENTAGFRCCAD